MSAFSLIETKVSAPNMWLTTDPHGCNRTLRALHREIQTAFPGEPLFISGDLIDRGPDSARLVQYCIEQEIPVCQGNHDRWMFLDQPRWNSDWFQNGGSKAWDSYHKWPGDQDPILRKRLFRTHQEWMKQLPRYFYVPQFLGPNGKPLFVSHAPPQGLSMEMEMRQESWFWHRTNPPTTIPYYCIFGHTPGPVEVAHHYAKIDTGCAYVGRSAEYGKLTAIRFPAMEVFQMPNQEGSTPLRGITNAI